MYICVGEVKLCSNCLEYVEKIVLKIFSVHKKDKGIVIKVNFLKN